MRLLKHFPSPPVLAGTLSGFVVGVFVTLIASGVVAHSSPTAAPPVAQPTVLPVPDPQMYQRVRAITVKQLGPSASSSTQPRLVSVKLVPAPRIAPVPPSAEGFPQFRSVIITFRLYDHPLGRVWRLRAAKADVFAVMKALYTSPLPVYDVRMIGKFPLSLGKKTTEQTALIAFLDSSAASRIPWKRWGRKQEAALWNALTFKRVDSRFA